MVDELSSVSTAPGGRGNSNVDQVPAQNFLRTFSLYDRGELRVNWELTMHRYLVRRER